ncbi:hypothetical protein [Streptosporangium sp. CA-115845]|uniref:hypothetical protein n=1 Tax=Streptosporangium sp. CA-115845 TaxID=3240071 RepID=UPI003D91FD78
MTTNHTTQAAAGTPEETEPIEGTVIPPDTHSAPAAELWEDDVDLGDEDEDERPEGIPAAHLAAGGLSTASVTLASLYQLLGLPGLIGGAVLTGGSAVAYVRHRHQRRQRSMSGVSWEAGRGGHGGRRSSGGSSGGPGVFGALRSEGRTKRASRSFGGRSSGAGAGLFGGSSRRSTSGRGAGSGSAGLGGLFGGDRSRSARGRASGSTGSAASRTGRRTTTSTGAKAKRGAATSSTASRNFGRRVTGLARQAGTRTAGAARTGAQRVRAASARTDAQVQEAAARTKQRAKRAYRATTAAARRTVGGAGRIVAARARRVGAWADRRTGGRVSTAWKAMRGADGGFTARRRRAAAALSGWDAQLTASLVALVALLVERVRRYRARKTAVAQDGQESEQDTKSDDTKEETKQDAPQETEEQISVVHGEPEPPISATVTCPRCGASHEVTVPGGQAKTVVTCGCGYSINFFRIPAGEAAQSTPSPQTTRIYRRTQSMSANPLAIAAAEVNAAAAGHAPADMWAVARELDQLNEVPANIAMAVRTYTMRLQGEYPIDPAVVEAIHQLYQGLAQLVPVAEEVAVLFRQAHADDLRREEAPRTNEQMWDVGRI